MTATSPLFFVLCLVLSGVQSAISSCHHDDEQHRLLEEETGFRVLGEKEFFTALAAQKKQQAAQGTNQRGNDSTRKLEARLDWDKVGNLLKESTASSLSQHKEFPNVELYFGAAVAALGMLLMVGGSIWQNNNDVSKDANHQYNLSKSERSYFSSSRTTRVSRRRYGGGLSGGSERSSSSRRLATFP